MLQGAGAADRMRAGRASAQCVVRARAPGLRAEVEGGAAPSCVGAELQPEGEGPQAFACGDPGERLDDAAAGPAQSAVAECRGGGAPAGTEDGPQRRLRRQLGQPVVRGGQCVPQEGVHRALAAEREQQLVGEPVVRPVLMGSALCAEGRQRGAGGAYRACAGRRLAAAARAVDRPRGGVTGAGRPGRLSRRRVGAGAAGLPGSRAARGRRLFGAARGGPASGVLFGSGRPGVERVVGDGVPGRVRVRTAPGGRPGPEPAVGRRAVAGRRGPGTEAWGAVSSLGSPGASSVLGLSGVVGGRGLWRLGLEGACPRCPCLRTCGCGSWPCLSVSVSRAPGPLGRSCLPGRPRRRGARSRGRRGARARPDARGRARGVPRPS